MKNKSRFNIKDIAACIVIVCAVLIVFLNLNIQSTEEFYSTHPTEIIPDGKSVTLTIECTDIIKHKNDLAEKFLENYSVDNGYIVKSETVALCKNDSVFDVLIRYCKSKKIIVNYSDNIEKYIKGINGISEFSCGPASGWKYYVNNTAPEKSCDKYALSNGDNVVFTFVCDYNEWSDYYE